MGRNATMKRSQSKHLEDLKNKLGLDLLKQKTINKKERKKRAKERKKALKAGGAVARVQTLASKSKPDLPPPEVVSYEDPRRKRKLEKAAAASKSESQISKPSKDEKKGLTKMTSEVTMKQARFEVFKFGLRGLDKASKKDAEIAQLLRLGAKPQKNKCIAYTDYKAQKRLEEEEAARRKEEDKQTNRQTD